MLRHLFVWVVVADLRTCYVDVLIVANVRHVLELQGYFIPFLFIFLGELTRLWTGGVFRGWHVHLILVIVWPNQKLTTSAILAHGGCVAIESDLIFLQLEQDPSIWWRLIGSIIIAIANWADGVLSRLQLQTFYLLGIDKVALDRYLFTLLVMGIELVSRGLSSGAIGCTYDFRFLKLLKWSYILRHLFPWLRLRGEICRQILRRHLLVGSEIWGLSNHVIEHLLEMLICLFKWVQLILCNLRLREYLRNAHTWHLVLGFVPRCSLFIIWVRICLRIGILIGSKFHFWLYYLIINLIKTAAIYLHLGIVV